MKLLPAWTREGIAEQVAKADFDQKICVCVHVGRHGRLSPGFTGGKCNRCSGRYPLVFIDHIREIRPGGDRIEAQTFKKEDLDKVLEEFKKMADKIKTHGGFVTIDIDSISGLTR